MVDETTVGRQPDTIVEIDQDFCQEVYATLPCTAALGTTGQRKCFNTRKTCQDPANYNPAALTLRFTKPRANARRGDYLIPLLADVSTKPTRLNPGGGGRSRGVLGERASVDVTFKDAPHTDRVVDKYRTERIDGTAQLDEGAYDPFDRATFWAKWLRRNPFYQNVRLRVLEGYVGQTLAAMRKREYFIDRIDGPDANGRVRITAKDVLKLADDDRAQAPVQSPGELELALALTETGSFTVVRAVLADYPDEPGLVRIGDEIIEYQTRSIASDVITFSTLTRAARGTEADDHDAEDRVQRCLEYVNTLCWKVVEDLLKTFAAVPTAFIPITDWDAEGDVWLQQFTVTSVISEPTGVVKLVEEIEEQCQFFIWWDEYVQEIRLKALRVPTETPVSLNDDTHILAGSSTLKEDPEQRVSQAWVYFDQRNPTESLDDEGNYRRVRISADLEAESSDQYGEPRIKKIFSRWLESDAQALQVSARILQRYRDNARFLTIRLDAKDRALKTADVADILTRTVVDDRGLEESVRYQVVSSQEDPPGEAVTYLMQRYEFTGRFAFYTESGEVDYSDLTQEDKDNKTGAWYAQADGTMPDGGEGYKLQ